MEFFIVDVLCCLRSGEVVFSALQTRLGDRLVFGEASEGRKWMKLPETLLPSLFTSN